MFGRDYEALTNKIYNLTRVSKKRNWSRARQKADKELAKQLSANLLDLQRLKTEKKRMVVETSDSNFDYDFYRLSLALNNAVIIEKIDQLGRMQQVSPRLAASFKAKLLLYQIHCYHKRCEEIDRTRETIFYTYKKKRSVKQKCKEEVEKLWFSVLAVINKVDASPATHIYRNIWLFEEFFDKKSENEIAELFSSTSKRAKDYQNKMNYINGTKNGKIRPIYRRPKIKKLVIKDKDGLFSWLWQKISAVFHWLAVNLGILAKLPPPPLKTTPLISSPLIIEEQTSEEPPSYPSHSTEEEIAPITSIVNETLETNTTILRLLQSNASPQQSKRTVAERLETTLKNKSDNDAKTETIMSMKLPAISILPSPIVEPFEFKEEKTNRLQDRRMKLHNTGRLLPRINPQVLKIMTDISPNEIEEERRRASSGRNGC